ncbi:MULTISPECIES: hypothetical protein [Paenibacillus]|uniref:hypothetical protein n=1 Tax=Paenibacillus TaxID=44249 RepID=UPI00137885E4|nr:MULTISPECIES: hypothetical protein [Paenibacillus]
MKRIFVNDDYLCAKLHTSVTTVGSDATVYFNPKSNPTIQTTDPKAGNVSGQKRPSYVGLVHELIHADRAMCGAQYEYKTMGAYIYQMLEMVI